MTFRDILRNPYRIDVESTYRLWRTITSLTPLNLFSQWNPVSVGPDNSFLKRSLELTSLGADETR